MKYFIRLRIDVLSEQLKQVNELLGISTIKENDWIHEVTIEEDDPYVDCVESYLNLLENNYFHLESIGISRSQISIWVIYQYENQCNMEFLPHTMKRLGDNEITLCVSCYES